MPDCLIRYSGKVGVRPGPKTLRVRRNLTPKHLKSTIPLLSNQPQPTHYYRLVGCLCNRTRDWLIAKQPTNPILSNLGWLLTTLYASDLPGLLLVCYLTLSGFTQDTHTSSTSEIILSLPSCLPSQSSWGFCLRLHVLSLPRQSAVVFSRMIVIINRLATHACYLGSTRSVLGLLEPAREFMLVKDQSL